MWGLLIRVACLAALLVGSWYIWFRYANRRRALQILSWVDHAFSGHAIISETRWHSASRFEVQLQLSPSVFRRVSLAIRLEPREMPFKWLLSRLRREKETVTFEAELDCRPAITLFVQNHRWSGRTLRTRPASWETWHFQSLSPVVICTQENWTKDVGTVLETLLAARSREFLHLGFRKEAPHFVACAPLQSLRPQAHGSALFDVLRELASSSLSSRY